jgi:hypothetical protein
MLSTLGRYRFFMHTGSWGVWYDSITAEDILSFPVKLTTAKDPSVRQIGSAVDELYRWESTQTPDSILAVIDEAVFDLFELTPNERDLVTKENLSYWTLGLAVTH